MKIRPLMVLHQLFERVYECGSCIGMTIGAFDDRREPLDNARSLRGQVSGLKLLQSCKQFLQISAIPLHLSVF